MTQTVNSSIWTTNIQFQALNFLYVVDPPRSLNKDEFIEQTMRLARSDEQGSVLPVDSWIFKNKTALDSVTRGLSQAGRIDRGSFATYASV